MIPAALAKILVFGAMTSVGAWLAFRALASYHDGLRPLLPELAAGRLSRAAAGKQTRDMSVGFFVAFAAPFSVITGVMVSHIVFLGADWIGVSFADGRLAALVGFAWGATASAGLSGVTLAISHLPRPLGPSFRLIGLPLLYMMPLMPVVAAAVQVGAWRAGWVALVTLLVVAGWSMHGSWIDPEAAGFIAGTAMVVYEALRVRERSVALPLDEFRLGAERIRTATLPLVIIGGLVGAAASLLWLAGEPAAAVLIGLHRPIDAALIALFSWLGFLPLVTVTSLGSRAYTTSGVPDGILGLGYLSQMPSLGFLSGAALMWAEVTGLAKIERWLAQFPGLHTAGGAIRDGMTRVLDLSLFVGGVISANSLWAGWGVLIVGAFWFLNEAWGVRVMRLAVGPIAAVITGLVVNALLFAHIPVPGLPLG